MNELTPKLPKQLEEALAKYYASPAPSAEFAARLEGQLRQNVKQTRGKQNFAERMSFMKLYRTRPLVAVLIVLLILLVLSGVVYALGRSLGYIPGIGLVDPSAAIRVLTEPVNQVQDGITVSIEQVIADSERTVIVYKTEGLSIAAANSKGEGGANPFGSEHLLRLPDGTTLKESTDYPDIPEPLITDIQTEGGWPNYVARLVYPPIPSQVNEITLLIPVLRNMPVGAAAENWSLTFRLKAAPADMTYMPVVELPSPTQTEAAAAPEVEATNPPNLSNIATLNGITLTLDNVIELDDGFVFTGSLSWDESLFPYQGGPDRSSIIPTLTDANGESIPIEEVPVDWTLQEGKLPWSYRTDRKNFSGSLVFSIGSIQVNNITTLPATDVQVDLGPDPQIGQVWELNQDFVIDGHTFHLSSVQLNGDCGEQMYDLQFNFTNEIGGVSTYVEDAVPQAPFDYSCEGGGERWTEGIPVDSKESVASTRYSSIPNGLHQFVITISFPSSISGPWQVTWNPPLSAEPPATPAPDACLTLEKWNQWESQNEILPPDVSGKILTTVDEGGSFPAIYVSDPAGNSRQKIAEGGWPTLSTDGTRLTYIDADGLHVLDLSNGQNFLLNTDGYHAVWSPDSTRMMYTTSFNLYVVNADGTGVQKVDTGSAQIVSPVGWLPDNQTLIYAAMGGEGFTFTTHNLQSGETKKLFSVQSKDGSGSISPDGLWIVFTDRIFGATYPQLFISRLDGSERSPIAEPEVLAISSSWSPNGQWLSITTLDSNGKEVQGLVNPFTCQVMPLHHINGMIEGWSP